jgi:hypothetical protein
MLKCTEEALVRLRPLLGEPRLIKLMAGGAQEVTVAGRVLYNPDDPLVSE